MPWMLNRAHHVPLIVLLALGLVVGGGQPTFGQGWSWENPAPAGRGGGGGEECGPQPEDQTSVTEHSITLDRQRLDYTATAGTLVLRDAAGKAKASVFHVAYTVDHGGEPGQRPVVFSFNGGPGAAAVWVHLGAFGPKRIAYADAEGMPLAPPGSLVTNPHTLLDVADLVFIDPIGTGWSRPAPCVEGRQFWGLEGDIESVGEFIRLWTTRHGRWSSPKFLAGESYGTTRASGLADFLQQRYSMYLNGVILISPILNWLNPEFAPGNDMPYLIHLPTYAATAHFHGQIAPEHRDKPLFELLEEVERFALGDYALALLQGDRLSPAERQRIAETVAGYTGLSVDFVLQNDLRIVLHRFQKELMRDDRVVVGRLDSRYTFVDRDAHREAPEFDPSLTAVDVGYVTMLNDYLRRDLGFESDLVYESLAFGVWPWDYSSHQNRYVNVADNLRSAMARNDDLKVLFACGVYDFATPYFDSEHTLAHMMLPAKQRANASISYYEAGHMMYVREADHAKFEADVEALISAALAADTGSPASD